VQKLSFYGNPLGSTVPTKTASLNLWPISAAYADGTADAANQTVQSLQDALSALGVTATVTPQVMDGTSLHALIMGQDNGLPPTPDQFKTDLNSWVVANFQLDDMVTPMTDPTQQAAMQQFKTDLETFIQRMHVAGKQVFLVLPIQTCDAPQGAGIGLYTAADGLAQMISQASGEAGAQTTGFLPYAYVTTQTGDTYTTVNTYTQGHLGTDCRTPDTYLLNARTAVMAKDIAAGLAAVGG
jgi:hypothetical protein